MRILIVCTDAELGGAERLLATLASARRTEDTIALAVLMTPGALSSQLESAFDEVAYLGFCPSSRNLPGMVRALERYARSFAPNVVSSHLFHADLVTALARLRVPKTTTVHTQGLSSSDHPLTRLIARAVGALSFRFDAVIPAGDSSQMAAFIRTLRMRNVVTPIPNAADVPDEPAFTVESRRLISLARNHPVKGHQQLFTAFALATEATSGWELVAYGTDVVPENENMQQAISAAGAEPLLTDGRIRLMGPTNQPELALSDASALVISSVYGEAFPIVGAEAAGLGIPVITTDLGSCAEFADDPRFLVPPGDAVALAHAFRIYMTLTDLERSELSRNARERAELNYHPRVAYEHYRSLFSELISRRASRLR